MTAFGIQVAVCKLEELNIEAPLSYRTKVTAIGERQVSKRKASGNRALVVGLGETGLSCARYLTRRGYRVTVVDSRPQPPRRETLKQVLPRVTVHTGGFDPVLFEHTDLVVVSPGISLHEPAIAQAIARGAEVVGDVELFARGTTAPVIAVTGSNGKSTVTALVGAMCREADMDAAVGGNIGVPVLDLPRDAELYVLELSSFQLETTSSLRPMAAAVLNISPDHMDRYIDLDDYARAKARIFNGDGAVVVNADDPMVMGMLEPGRRALRFGLGEPAGEHDFGIRCHGGQDWLAKGERLLLASDEVLLTGRHNLANALAAMALAEVAAVPVDAMTRALRGFHGLSHRTELVRSHGGIRWIDDSKGTNVGATVAALKGMGGPVVLIAGGDGKGADFSPLRPVIRERARALVLIGRDAAHIEAAVGDAVPTVHAGDMVDAVAKAAALAHPGDVVLLSPACASFDMFRDYRHRGEVFAAAVRGLVT